MKGRSTLHIIVANYTNEHVTFNKGQCIGHIEPFIDHMPYASIKKTHLKKMMDEYIQPDTFTPPVCILQCDVRKSLNQLLETFKL